MNNLKIPVGISDFKKVREEGYYYIDKSTLIQEFLKAESTEVTLITRPRRFGKTINMSMLAHFFDIREDSKRLFEDLEISRNQDLCATWMNQCPTLFVSFKDVNGTTFENAFRLLKFVISDICVEHEYLKDSDKVSEAHKQIFMRLEHQTASITDVQSSLYVIMKMMKAYYGRPVILLFDEYDVPIAKASSNGYYNDMMEVIRTIMSMAFKDNTSLRFAAITGCLRIAKESIFTGTNNFTTDTISDSRYNEFFGFTQNDVEKLLLDADCEEHLRRIQKWYDGYHFGDLDVYCPWDVLSYIKKVIETGITTPENFWENTSGNEIIELFLDHTDFDVSEKFETLLKGGYVKETISEDLTYNILTSTEGNLWSLLYLTGYLTQAKPEELNSNDQLNENQAALKIPNEEVMDIFNKSTIQWFNKKAAKSDRQDLFNAMWDGEAEKLTERLSDLLFDTISFHDYAENFYHAFMTGLFSASGYVVESNYENGFGRSDIVVKDRSNRRAVVFEVKIAKSNTAMEKECQKALNQIEEKQYARKIEHSGFKTVIRYGIAFYQKGCLVKK